MGADYYAKVVIGVRVQASKLYEKKTVKAFDHDFPSDWKVDPKSGRSLWERQTTFVLGEHGVLEDDYEWRDGRQPKGAKAAVVFEQGRGDDRGDHAYIGRVIAQIEVGRQGENGNKKVVDSDFDLTHEAAFLRELLEPLGLWNKRNFGVWLVSYVSC